MRRFERRGQDSLPADWNRMFKESDIAEDLRRQTAEKWAPTLGPIMNEPKPW